MRYCYLRFPEGRFKALTLSYDDGVMHDRRLCDTATKNGIKLTLNVNSGSMPSDGGHWRMSADEILEITEPGGHEIALHGDRHVALGKANAFCGINEVLECRKQLERRYGKIIRGYAYADSGIREMINGIPKSEIKSYLKALGVAYARSTWGDNDKFLLPEDFYEWVPTAHHNNPNLMIFLEKFINMKLDDYAGARMPRLFYLWGHSFEFDRNNNWEILESFCERAGGMEDIWYATNIEICDYVNAFRLLMFTVDGDIVHNPTSTKIWFELDKKPYVIEPGETIRCEVEPAAK